MQRSRMVAACRLAAACLAAVLLATAAPPALAADPVATRIYQPPQAPLSLRRLGPTARTLEVRTDDGLTLNGIVVPPGDKPVLLVLHGVGTSADDVGAWLGPVAARGYGLVLAEYRGFAGNPGEPSQKGLATDARAFLRKARALFPGRRILVVGHSLGGGVAFDLALVEPIDTLVTIGTFVGLRQVAPPLARPFIKDRFDNMDALGKLPSTLPYYLLHGTADDVIPPGNANRLHNLAVTLRRPGATVVLTGQGHRPDPAVLADVLDYIVAEQAGAAPNPPGGARINPFR